VVGDRQLKLSEILVWSCTELPSPYPRADGLAPDFTNARLARLLLRPYVNGVDLRDDDILYLAFARNHTRIAKTP
jgi:hypothetical protein